MKKKSNIEAFKTKLQKLVKETGINIFPERDHANDQQENDHFLLVDGEKQELGYFTPEEINQLKTNEITKE